MESISLEELTRLRQKVQPTVWLIRTFLKDEKLTYRTGFRIRKDGILMTCAHGIMDAIPANAEILARKIDEDVYHRTKLICMRPNWDVMLFKVGVECEAADFVVDDTIQEGQTLLVMGHASGLLGSFYVAHGAYRCPNSRGITLPAANDLQNWTSYKSRALTYTPAYRVKGDICDKSDKYDVDQSSDIFDHPLIPMVQCRGFKCSKGCSGGPLLDTNGEIVGMVVYMDAGYTMAYHASGLKEFFRCAIEQPVPAGDTKGKTKIVHESRSESTSKKLKI